MPQHSHLAEAPSNTSYGQVIEYIAGEPPQPRNYCSTPGQVPTGYAPLQGSAIDVSGQYSDIPFSTLKTACTLPPTPTSPTRTHLSRTQQQSSQGPPARDLPERSRVPKQHRKRSHRPYTSPSTTACSTMLSTPTLALCTLVTCTALQSCCTMCLRSRIATAGLSSSGATRTRGVSY